MAIGHFIVSGDKTTCGGVVTEGDSRVIMFGFAHARDGDPVTCGKDGNTYRIVGGVSYIDSHGRLVAGTLDSFSGCPCRAGLIPSVFTASYTSQVNSISQATSQTARSSPPRTLSTSPSDGKRPVAAAHSTAATAPSCDEHFQFINPRRLPLGPLSYALLENGECLAFGKLDGHGMSLPHVSANPVSLSVAISAPSPALE